MQGELCSLLSALPLRAWIDSGRFIPAAQLPSVQAYHNHRQRSRRTHLHCVARAADAGRPGHHRVRWGGARLWKCSCWAPVAAGCWTRGARCHCLHQPPCCCLLQQPDLASCGLQRPTGTPASAALTAGWTFAAQARSRRPSTSTASQSLPIGRPSSAAVQPPGASCPVPSS
jgi:hypothetical protein